MSVLISGGSIAGPSLAFWLARYGFRPTLVEQAGSLREGGYAIDIRGVAMKVADLMGIGEAVRQARTGMAGVSIVDGTGRTLARVPSEYVVGAPGDVEIKRGDLSGILYEATRTGTEYIFGDSIASIDQRDNGIDVSFEHGPPRTFDIVVGADGLHSNVRRLVFGPETPFIHELGYYISIFSVEPLPDADQSTVMYNTPGKLAGVYNARGSSYAILGFASDRLDYDYRDDDEQMGILERVLADAGWVTPQLLTQMRQAPDFYFDEISQIQMDAWTSGRVALVGDAGYGPSPLSGQGTSLAMVGAYVLAGELASAKGDHGSAFSRYEQKMREYVRANQKIAMSGAPILIPKTAVQLWLRNHVMRALPYIPKLRIFRRKLDRAANAITLTDYPIADV